MKTLYLDPFSGISGDMVLGLLVDLGLPVAELETALTGLPIAGWTLRAEREQRQGITGTRLRVECAETHHHRTWRDIDQMLAQSTLPAPVRDLARRIFLRIGTAEAKIHDIALEEVHFHEVGALDSIVDVVGAAAGLTALKIDQVVCAPLPMSRGFVRCAHGTFPLPAPATLEILRGLPVIDGNCDFELVTPTGAAIAAEIANFASLPAMRIERCGYGVGGRNLADRPNLLRGILGETAEQLADTDQVEVLETHLDDCNPEWLGALMEDLLAAGALDVAFSPLQMKKNRPGVGVRVIAPAGQGRRLAAQLLRDSSAIGVRRQLVERLKLARESAQVATPWGSAEVKLLRQGGRLVRITPEFESCRQLARRAALPLPEVYRLVEAAARDSLDQGEHRE
ncbi:nickel pincer cofactor biosynthesis protein LarC [Geoalkalibacter halelectricus]|uniref:Putative nickel insertion protein n=1 Tax=Geoalkalibacter halelectricus TaxID=2847045 RepID=A0ABY5ZNX8_9BACT|nr:nickel pincer cofactor biosynthesis protein LarC [Geoalkalibacter halelectricus]MDO3377433.1 nickel pincer cofactor biosynthesis protein LarC [Geoalkalibacter halelectricus]UWZ80806.1 nickel pincer cofactor biosynthesis protein LarC [Geoalkalibacter halelectricus]